MGVSSGLSGRYAKAIYELAEEKKILTNIVDDFVRLKKLLEDSDSLTSLINSPAISKSDKKNLILKILNKAKVSLDKKVSEWSDNEIGKIRDVVGTIKIEGELRSEVQLNIKRLMDIGSYRGIRHRTGLPLRGQRTKNNSRTRKGKRKTVANKKKVTKA